MTRSIACAIASDGLALAIPKRKLTPGDQWQFDGQLFWLATYRYRTSVPSVYEGRMSDGQAVTVRGNTVAFQVIYSVRLGADDALASNEKSAFLFSETFGVTALCSWEVDGEGRSHEQHCSWLVGTSGLFGPAYEAAVPNCARTVKRRPTSDAQRAPDGGSRTHSR